MKRTMTALLLALALVLSLSGCTSKKDTGSNGTANNGTANNDNGNTNNGTVNGGTNSGENSTAQPGNNNRLYNGYDSYAQPGSNGSTSSDFADDFMAGRSYEDMLRNGRVHDRDGILTDGENSVSEW